MLNDIIFIVSFCLLVACVLSMCIWLTIGKDFVKEQEKEFEKYRKFMENK